MKFGEHYIGLRHLNYLVWEYVEYYDTERPHSVKEGPPLQGWEARKTGAIRTGPKLGGLFHHYYRVPEENQ